ncbi:NAD-dependent epimerase/dehydratase family protein [Pseudodesulfovibrio cashew]|uniref:NAD-dependent epimerase/dehydratase family protein n=1 Tax=Pseudodesulfovibrio cashew TaxID=2678688 RepID=A0A6I6JKR0_9BACT|nr:SDR family oxidoreductase [Pseudodesulfovibrio cashew]QGY40893.1 NAD-dependent epimerase/dehydratase family protein [Pseudodesulfovibrio cashew]
MSTILITGAGGYIGTTLTDLLLENGHKVIGLDRYFFGQALLGETLDHPNFTLVKGDVRSCEKELFKGVDAVCDLAALSNDPSGDLDGQLTTSINFEGRSRIAQKAKEAGVRRYVLASSCSVYGAGTGIASTEETSPKPLTTYAECNIKAENAAFALSDDDFCVSALRLATVYGLSKRMRFDLAVNIMTYHAFANNEVQITGGGEQWRPFVHVRDVARAFMTVLETDTGTVNGEIFNVGGNEHNYQISTLAYIIREVLPFPVAVNHVLSDPDRRDYNVQFSKINKVLGFEPQYAPVDGAQEIYEALKMNKVRFDDKSVTVKWYKYLIEADRVISEVKLDGRLLK